LHASEEYYVEGKRGYQIYDKNSCKNDLFTVQTHDLHPDPDRFNKTVVKMKTIVAPVFGVFDSHQYTSPHTLTI